MGDTPAGVGGVIVWLELNGLSEVADGAVECRCLKMRRRSTQIRRDIIGIGLNCLGVVRNGTINLLIGVGFDCCLGVICGGAVNLLASSATSGPFRNRPPQFPDKLLYDRRRARSSPFIAFSPFVETRPRQRSEAV